MISRQKEIRLGSITTSETEVRDLIKAWIAISIAFAILLRESMPSSFYLTFITTSLTVGIGFLLHELGHKVVAQRYGCLAEFRSFDNMLIFAVVMSFFGFVLAAPGAVMISGKISRNKNGVISAAGPLVNLALAVIFFGLALSHPSGLLKIIASYGFLINSWLALFNMVPFWLFDGYKVWKWNKIAYFSIAGLAFLFVALRPYLLLQK